ncbi:hypothetical protein [Clostridium sp.]|jgi:hypothetical protein|uniref:hypothetical protein n=1 Tax=Clostridium sp. TaxID=1506 RepID=UPI003EEC78D5
MNLTVVVKESEANSLMDLVIASNIFQLAYYGNGIIEGFSVEVMGRIIAYV